MTKDEVIAMMEDDVAVRKAAIRAFIMDENNPRYERVEVWKLTPEHLLHHQSWIITLPKFEAKYGEIVWYDDCYAERYSTVDLRDLHECGYFYKGNDFDGQKWHDFVDECINLGYQTFTYDW